MSEVKIIMNRPLWTYDKLDEKIIQKLNSNGFYYKEDIDKNLEYATKLVKNISEIINNCNKVENNYWKNGDDILVDERRFLDERNQITTLCKKLDELLNGGIQLGKITELYGNSGCGKTQLCLQLAINTTLPNSLGGLESNTVYIETTKSIYNNRLNNMIETYVNYVKVRLKLQNMKVTETIEPGPSNTTQSRDISKPRINIKNKFLEREKQFRESFFKNSTEIEKTQLCKINETLETVNDNLELNETKPEEDSNKEFTINISKKDLNKLINKSKKLNTNINKYLNNKIEDKINDENDINVNKIKSKIKKYYCKNINELISLLLNIKDYIKENNNIIKLIIIDNITYLFHNENNNNYLKRTKNIYFILNLLNDIAIEYNIAVLITNQLTTKYINYNQENSNCLIVPALGETFGHKINIRMFLQRYTSNMTSYSDTTLDNDDIMSSYNEVKKSKYNTSHSTTDDNQLILCLIDKMCLQNEKSNNKKHCVFRINKYGIRDVD